MNKIDNSWYQRPKNIIESLSVGGIIIRSYKEKLTVALVREEPFTSYILPKGGMKANETFEGAARREILEEAGLSQLILLKELGVQERLNFAKTSWKVIHYYLFLTEQEQGIPTDNKHAYVCEWFSLDDLPSFFWQEQKVFIEEKKEEIVSLVKTYINDRNLIKKVKQENYQEQQLFEVTRTISSALDLGTILHNILSLSIDLVSADEGALGMIIPNTKRMTSPYLFNATEKITELRSLPKGEELAWMIIESGKPIMLQKYQSPESMEFTILKGKEIQEIDSIAQGLYELNICGLLGAPITAGDVPLGALLLYSYSHKNVFTERSLDIIDAVGRQAGVAIINARLYEEIQEFAISDPLMGIYNRRYLYDIGSRELERIQRYRHALSLIMFDLDLFKHVNDTYGHAAGDMVLQRVCNACLEILRQSDTLCRFGGEEFVVLMPETSLESAVKVAERMRQAFAGLALIWEDITFHITVSFGVACLNNKTEKSTGDMHDFDALIQSADEALYLSKTNGRNRVTASEK